MLSSYLWERPDALNSYGPEDRGGKERRRISLAGEFSIDLGWIAEGKKGFSSVFTDGNVNEIGNIFTT